MTSKVYSFYDHNNDCTRALVTNHGKPIGYTAIDADNYDFDWPVGYGDTELSAIYDLNKKMIEAELWPASLED